jgi:tetratricopeptide (TPR) repeat protein
VNALGEALSLANQASDPSLLAEVRTNQASALLRRERGDVSENRRIAAALCRDALEYRTPWRDPIEWAQSQIMLADSLDALARLGEADQKDAIAAYAAILDVGELQVKAPWAIGSAHYGIARLMLRAASEALDDRVPGDESRREPTPEVTEWLVAAREHLKQSVAGEARLADEAVRGRALSLLAQTYFRLGEMAEALRYGREALALLTPVTDPYECSTIAWAVADWLADQERWEEASDSFRLAVDASELALHARVLTDMREYEMKRVGGMYRWASYAHARAGRCEEAALVLDIGRSRELRRRLGTDEYSEPLIDRVPEELRSEYEAAICELTESTLGADPSQAGERLQEVLAQIRAIPGLAGFTAEARPDDLFRSVEDGWPVVYINPTPRGLCLLRVVPSPGGATVDSCIYDAPRSMEVLMRVVGGVSSTNPADWPEGGLVSYVREASGFAEGRGDGLVDALGSLLPWIGETVMHPLWEFVRGPDIRGLTLIPCGPLALAPLAACPWTENDLSRCLLDHVPVRYPPSALIAGISLDRAADADAHGTVLVGLADPEREDSRHRLLAAGPELHAIAQLFDPDSVQIAEGTDATSDFLRQHAGACSHLHLACHGKGEVTDASQALVSLADTTITAHEVAALPLRASRLVVLSACQTAVQQLNDIPDEALSVSTSFLAAGTACVIASLWSVDDAATAMLMVRMYEEMMVNGERPPEALRNAQLWLRDLSDEDELSFLEQHPELRTESLRRREAGYPVGGRASQQPETRPFAHPALWAAFVPSGV